MADSLEQTFVCSVATMSPGRIATLACLLEVSASKPGNVNRGADFEDVTFNDFVISAVALGESIDRTRKNSLGESILDAVRSTKTVVGKNTNLGMILLLVPLAKCAAGSVNCKLGRSSVQNMLAQLDAEDCRLVYEAINLASPGGLGKVQEFDVHESPPMDLIEAMKLAENRDLIARQYVNGFKEIFRDVVGLLRDGLNLLDDLSQAIVFTHVHMMSIYPDSLIARKNGLEIAEHSRFLANKCVDALDESLALFWRRVGEMDFWLRSDGHRRNPGTTADMIAAGLFVAVFNRQISLSRQFE